MTSAIDSDDPVALRALSADQRALYQECRARIEQGLERLPDKPEETPAATLAALWHAAGARARSAAMATAEPLVALSDEGQARLRELVARRMAGIPLAHLTGRQQFMGLELLAGADALIPRRETEILGHAALDLAREIAASRGSVSVVDVCTGSGNLAVALAVHEPRARVRGSDLSPEAVALAVRNAALHGLDGRATFATGDLLDPFGPEFDGAVDLLVCNPPYISSAKVGTMPAEIASHEPRLAFDGGPLGIRILTRLIGRAPRVLREGGWLAFEVGLGQGRGIRQRLERHGAYDQVGEVADEQGDVRVLRARRASGAGSRD